MADTSAPIPSAVVLPEPPPSPTPSTKRRPSDPSSPNPKRPRLSNPSSPKSTRAPLASAPSRRNENPIEERKRGQRLFGALLGTLSQSSTSSAQKRRTDIERKQQAKLKLQAEEDDEKKKKALDELISVRRREGRKFDEQSMRIRHSNMLAMANFLRTEAEPRLYYKPWELLPGDEERIKTQISEAEALVEREVEEFKLKQRALEDEERNGEDDRGGGTNGEKPKGPDTVGADTDVAEIPNTTQDERTNGTAAPIVATPAPDPIKKDSEKENGDDSGEVMLEADEDTVIY